ncbi:E3 CR1-alpha [Simian adenovirus 48]|uniref:E3 CR1-alpha n=1 Tax=Simian adenovirus 48 TaxID=995021 RepID=A0A9W3I4Q3_9ADEN|nr:E3 CR1-alpha [Simian adenovirus 48]
MLLFTKLSWIIYALNLISKTNAYIDYSGHPCVNHRVTNVFSNHRSGITLNCSFWSRQLSWYFNDRPLSGSLGYSDGGASLHLKAPLHFGNYTCRALPCEHTFSLQPCPPSHLIFADYRVLSLNCSLFGPTILWSYNNSRLVEFNYLTQTTYGVVDIPYSIYIEFLSTLIAEDQQLFLQHPFIGGSYSCHVGSCAETFIVINQTSRVHQFTTNFYRKQLVLFSDLTDNITLECACPSYPIVTWHVNQTLWRAYYNEDLILKNLELDYVDFSSHRVTLFFPFYTNTTITCEVITQPCKTIFKFLYLPPESVKLIETFNAPTSAPTRASRPHQHWLAYAGLLAVLFLFLINIFACFIPFTRTPTNHSLLL